MIRYLTALLIAFFSTSAFAGALLTDQEKQLIPHINLSFGATAMLASDFEKNSETPATVVLNGVFNQGGGFSIIERNGERAFILDSIAMSRLRAFPAIMFVVADDDSGTEPAKTIAPVCESSCIDDVLFGAWDGMISGGSGGAAMGGGIGGAAGWYVAGPPGAAAGAAGGAGAGAVVGGAVGAAVGGTKGAQSCEKEKEAAGCEGE